MKEFWEEQHKNNEIRWLTNTEPNWLFDAYKMKSYIYGDPTDILEIGVGYGRSIRTMAELGHNVYGVDISETALEKIKDVATGIQSFKDEWPTDKVELAICHLVFQHCDDANFEYLIGKTIESLKTDGVFKFQVADCFEHLFTPDIEDEMSRGLLYFRDYRTVNEVVKKSGGEIINCSQPLTFQHTPIFWYQYTIKKGVK